MKEFILRENRENSRTSHLGKVRYILASPRSTEFLCSITHQFKNSLHLRSSSSYHLNVYKSFTNKPEYLISPAGNWWFLCRILFWIGFSLFLTLGIFFQLRKLDKIALWWERFDCAHKIKCSLDGERLYQQATLCHFKNKCHYFWFINLLYLWFFAMSPWILL